MRLSPTNSEPFSPFAEPFGPFSPGLESRDPFIDFAGPEESIRTDLQHCFLKRLAFEDQVVHGPPGVALCVKQSLLRGRGVRPAMSGPQNQSYQSSRSCLETSNCVNWGKAKRHMAYSERLDASDPDVVWWWGACVLPLPPLCPSHQP